MADVTRASRLPVMRANRSKGASRIITMERNTKKGKRKTSKVPKSAAQNSTSAGDALQITTVRPLYETLIVTPQSSALLKLPLELRLKIYQYCFDDSVDCTLTRDIADSLMECLTPGSKTVEHHPYVNPCKNKGKFSRFMNPTFIALYNTLLCISRQTYHEIIGISLLDSKAAFFFDSPHRFRAYLPRVVPVATNRIRHVAIRVLLRFSESHPKAMFNALTQLGSLENLYIIILVSEECSDHSSFILHARRHMPLMSVFSARRSRIITGS